MGVKGENINELILRMGWGAMICDESTYMSWYR